ncbi:uncharacterized protein LOC143348752 [Colletes latitarsis]|uniref:uncharacterized protein LOC143348752 n=1 Tax=Colletes latitarsis TaxID=2605962 RepID=UPI004035E317
MAVSEELSRSDLEDQLTELTEEFDRLKALTVNLKKMGRAKYSEKLLEEKLTYATQLWRDTRTLYMIVRRMIPAAKRQAYELFKPGYLLSAENEFQEFQNYVTTEIDRIVAEPKPATTEVQPPNMLIELPKQRLPKFGGGPREWEHFEDLLTSGVIRNASLSDVQRLFHLNACLEGPALATISSFEIVGRNFPEAWKTLKEKYGLPRLITGKLLDKLLYLKPIDLNDLASMQQITVDYTETIAALRKRGTPEQLFEWLLAHWAKQHFTPKLELEWQRTLGPSTEYPTFEDVRKFIDHHAQALLSMNEDRREAALASEMKSRAPKLIDTRQKSVASRAMWSHNVVVNSNPVPIPRGPNSDHDGRVRPVRTEVCGFCAGPHQLVQCHNFKVLPARVRSQYVRSRQWCLQCLASSHTVMQCQSSLVCHKCSGRHHSLLHYECTREEASARPLTNNAHGRNQESRVNGQPTRSAKSKPRQKNSASNANLKPASTSHCTALGTGAPRPVVLATARVHVFGKNGATRIARALLDQGSETSFISAGLANDLNLKRIRTPATVSGLGGGQTQAIKYSVNLNLGSQNEAKLVCIGNVYVVPKITTYHTPTASALVYNAFRGLQLADANPAADQTIEILIGADLYAQIIRAGFRRGSINGPIAQDAAFGWVISGPINAAGETRNTIRTLHCTVLESLDYAIQRFWETEEIPVTSVRFKAEEECEALFRKTVRPDATGRFIVRLPLNHSRPDEALGRTLHIALSALTRLRRKLDADSTLDREYSEFLAEYESLSHMTQIEPIDQGRLYIPH